MPTIVFVCYGNICRSPFAEVWARTHMQAAGNTRFSFASGGVGATPGTSCPKHALQAARQFGADLRPHRSQRVRDMEIRSMDLVIAMDRYVFGELALDLSVALDAVEGPGGAPLRLLLQELSSSEEPGQSRLDVPDPMGLGLDAYLSSYKLIRTAVEQLVSRLSGSLP